MNFNVGLIYLGMTLYYRFISRFSWRESILLAGGVVAGSQIFIMWVGAL